MGESARKFLLSLLEDKYQKKPTFGNMLWLQIERLSTSSDKADIALRNFLEREFIKKKYKRELVKSSYIDLIHAVNQTYEMAHHRNISIASAAEIVSKKSGIAAKTIENGVTKYKPNYL